MKTPLNTALKSRLLTVLASVSILSLAHAASDKKFTPGPKGGKLLEAKPLRAEFFVDKDRKVSVTFYDAELKPAAVTEQSVSVIVQGASKTTLEFEKQGDSLLSKTPLPEGEGYTVVTQIKAKADDKAQNFRIVYQTHPCAKCNQPEYACICDE